ncbi:nitronate monooxygenase [Candidatus Cytomitobacter indipagum]|uniref:Nitronate monooxygenase n=1 Tax=Candidatus Cytomitobacter indipagum TaxID=2601575 RepID=A0A5C0UDZ0_9PROT|nr:nitronate monooxygenase [Candidatus Cytomitobacter indipagum]QEK38295.1 nitronate monooxygenase [Candidatus Cytomitobacter indipagum]
MSILNKMIMNGKEIFPLVEGGKGISATNGESSGAWAACGGIGTISAVYGDVVEDKLVQIKGIDGFDGPTRDERSLQLAEHTIKATVSQIKIAKERSNGNGLLNINLLWELAKTKEIMHGVLEKAGHLLNGVTCGAGIPYKLAEIVSKYGLLYYPIVSSALVFKILWKRAYSKYKETLGAVVYEDPWVSGGHLGISNREDPKKRESALDRVISLRKTMNELGLQSTPIIMAGGVWHLSDYEKDWINNDFLQPIMFQLGTRPLLTQESPISDEWKMKLFDLKEGDVEINKFSPTGFYSSAVGNSFLRELQGISERQVAYSREKDENFSAEYKQGRRSIYFHSDDLTKVLDWNAKGYDKGMYTPDETIVFVTEEKSKQIVQDQINCVGCLSNCKFSNWSNSESGTTGMKPDPRSFCIYKTLHNISHGQSVDNNLMFGGYNAYKFGQDPFYFKNGKKFIPTVKELFERMLTGY